MIQMNSFLADELINKVHHLSKALKQAEIIVQVLEQQNKDLMDALNSLASENNEDYVLDGEVCRDRSLAV